MSIFRFTSETEGGVPVLSVEPGYKPCAKTRPGAQMRARTVIRGGQLVCPNCERLCVMPHDIGQGNEFVVYRPEKTKRR